MKSSLTLLIVLSISQLSYSKETRHDKRENRQQHRIEQGVQSGELTTKEAERLLANDAQIEQKQDEFLSDGELSKDEKYKLEKMQDHQNDAIKRKKHNLRDRNDSRF